MIFTFVPPIHAMPRSSSSICVAKVAVTRFSRLQNTPLLPAGPLAVRLPYAIPNALRSQQWRDPTRRGLPQHFGNRAYLSINIVDDTSAPGDNTAPDPSSIQISGL